MLQAWFVSDIHLTSMQDEKAGKFLAFLNSLQKSAGTTHLFLVGDIFDLWIADHKYFLETYRPIIEEIQRLQNEDIEVHYFEGNHDLYLKGFWQQVLGVQVHAGPEYFQLQNWRVRVEHGDQSNPEDRGYLFLRWFLRTPVMKWLAHRLPESVVLWIGKTSSAKSRTYTSNAKSIAKEEAVNRLRTHAKIAYDKKAYDLLISGHVHVRDDFQFTGEDGRNVRAVNLGTWLEQPVALELTTEAVSWREDW